jgi:signal transduction histidine kinase
MDCVQWIGRNISHRKEADKMRQDLVNMLVHDLRGPVGNLINVIEMLPMLVDAANESAAFQNILEMARRSGQEVKDLIDSMLDVGLLEQGEIPLQRTPIILQDLVSAVYDQVEPRASAKEMELIIDPLPEAPVLFIDSSMIRRVLINLIDNGIKYTPNQGRVTLTTKLCDDVLHFAVSDNGPGITKADQSHIFDKFSRVDHTAKVSGVGLGLAFCKLAVQAHGGDIQVESEGIRGQGSIFRISIPIGPDEPYF